MTPTSISIAERFVRFSNRERAQNTIVYIYYTGVDVTAEVHGVQLIFATYSRRPPVRCARE